MSGSSTEKAITVSFALAAGNGSFSEGSNTATVSGLRVSATVKQVGFPATGIAQIRIYGLPPAMINQLTTLGNNWLKQINNVVEVQAGDSTNGMSLVFQGVIQEAYPDFAGAPEVSFLVTAYGALQSNMAPIAPCSYSGSTSVAVIMANIAAAAVPPLQFHNSGVEAYLSNPYFAGDVRTQVMQCAQHAGINAVIDERTNTLAIWPAYGSRDGSVPVISPDTGMIGYPAFQSNRVIVQTLYNPAILYGAEIEIQSSLTPACGLFTVYSLTHDLECLLPKGRWQSTITAFPVSQFAPSNN